MCGIVGIVAKHHGMWAEHENFFEEMLYVDGPRGMDSTGVFMVGKNNEVRILKQAANPGIFIQTQSWWDMKRKVGGDTRILVGHNRKSTVGATVSKNAHPFSKEHIVLVHNGYISNHKELDKEVEVDSEAIVSVLVKEKDPLQGLKQLFGAYAIVWYNRNERKLYLARNKERPLAMAESDNHVYFASEKGMLDWLMERNKQTNFTPAKDLTEDVLYEMSFRPYALKEAGIPAREWFPKPNPEYKEILEGDRSCVDDCMTGIFNEAEFNEEDRLRYEALANRTGELAPPKGTGYIMEKGVLRPKTEQDAESKVASLRKVYPFGSTVLFFPRNITIEGEKPNRYVKVRGDMWVPSKLPWKATYVVLERQDKEEYLEPGIPLIAKVQSMNRRGDDIQFCLESLRRASSMVTSANGLVMSDEEWRMICNKLVCGTCNKAPMTNEAKYTEVLQPVYGRYELTCASCFTEVYKGKPSKVSPDVKDNKPSINQ